MLTEWFNERLRRLGHIPLSTFTRNYRETPEGLVEKIQKSWIAPITHIKIDRERAESLVEAVQYLDDNGTRFAPWTSYTYCGTIGLIFRRGQDAAILRLALLD